MIFYSITLDHSWRGFSHSVLLWTIISCWEMSHPFEVRCLSQLKVHLLMINGLHSNWISGGWEKDVEASCFCVCVPCTSKDDHKVIKLLYFRRHDSDGLSAVPRQRKAQRSTVMKCARTHRTTQNTRCVQWNWFWWWPSVIWSILLWHVCLSETAKQEFICPTMCYHSEMIDCLGLELYSVLKVHDRQYITA